MANCCWTEVTYKGDSDDIQRLLTDLIHFMKEEEKRPPSERGWMGRFLEQIGIDYEKYSCRSTFMTDPRHLEEYDVTDTRIDLSFEDAWGPQDVMAIISVYYDLSYSYFAEESGNGVYQTNDPDEYGQLYLESRDYDEDLSKEDMIKLGVPECVITTMMEDRTITLADLNLLMELEGKEPYKDVQDAITKLTAIEFGDDEEELVKAEAIEFIEYVVGGDGYVKAE